MPEKTVYETLPDKWPGAFGVFRYAKAVALLNWKPYLVISILFMITSFYSTSVDGTDKVTTGAAIVSAIGFILTALLMVPLTTVELAGIKGKKVSLKEAFAQNKSYYLYMLLASILAIAILIGSLVLLILPFLFVLPRIILFSYFIIDKNLGPKQAIQASWAATKGHSFKVWAIIIVTILFAAIMLTVIGIPIALYLLFMYGPAAAVLYKWMEKTRSSSQLDQPTSPIEAAFTPTQPIQ